MAPQSQVSELLTLMYTKRGPKAVQCIRLITSRSGVHVKSLGTFDGTAVKKQKKTKNEATKKSFARQKKAGKEEKKKRNKKGK